MWWLTKDEGVVERQATLDSQPAPGAWKRKMKMTMMMMIMMWQIAFISIFIFIILTHTHTHMCLLKEENTNMRIWSIPENEANLDKT